MVLLFKLMFTYQTYAAEVTREAIFFKRIECLKTEDQQQYVKLVVDSGKQTTEAKIEVKNMIFDYFNIISKEYELAYTKYSKDKDYIESITAIQSDVEKQMVESKFVAPEDCS